VSASNPTDRETFRSFTFGQRDDGADGLAEPLGRSEVITSLGAIATATRHAVAVELASSVASLLDFDLVGVVAAGWKKQDALVAAAKRTAADPSAEEVVELATHRITSVHRPTIDLLLDGVRIGTLHVEATFDCVLDGVVGTVARGRLIALRYGRCTATATVTAEGVEIARRDGVVDLGLETSLGEGIVLVPEQVLARDATTVLLDDSSPSSN